MSSEARIKVVKSPVSPVRIPDIDTVMYRNRVVYYVRLSNGLVATNPDDFPEDLPEELSEDLSDEARVEE